MDRLFWRVFGSFWLLLFTFAGATLAINYFAPSDGGMHSPRGPLPPGMPFNGDLGFITGSPTPPPNFARMGSGFGPGPNSDHGPGPRMGPGPGDDHLLVDVDRILKTQGPSGITRYFASMQGMRGAKFYLFDSHCRSVGRSIPSPQVVALARRTLHTGRFQMTFDHDAMLHASLMEGLNHHKYVIVDSLAPPPVDWTWIVVRVLGALAMATLICWWLTYQITRPIHILRNATCDVASGKFNTRTGPHLNGRRDEIGMLGEDFDKMASQLQTLNNAQARLLADVSHELRSPLTRLTLASAIARRSRGNDTQSLLDRVDREAARLNELIGQLSTLSQIDLTSSHKRDQRVDLIKLIDSVIESAAFEAAEKDCTITKQSDTDKELFLSGDYELLRRTFENVLRNAIRYTFNKSTICVEIITLLSARSVEVTITDQGPGVPEAELQDIFRPFYRTSIARDRQSGGVGLGLAIAKRAASDHGGSIKAYNRLDGHCGLSVTITLPSLGSAADLAA